MTTIRFHKTVLVTMTVAALGLSACTAERVIDNTVGVAAGTTKVAAKGVWGAGRMVYRGVAGSED